MRFILIVIGLWFSASVHAEILSSKDLFTSPDNEMPRLSPDGKWLSYIGKEEEGTYLNVVDTESMTSYPQISLTQGDYVEEYAWVNGENLYLKIRNGTTSAEFLLKVTTKKRLLKYNFRRIETNGFVVDLLPDDPERVLYAKRERSRKGFELYEIDLTRLRAGNFKDLQAIELELDIASHFFYDNQSDKLVSMEWDEGEELLVFKFKPLHGGKWQSLFRLKDNDYNFIPKAFISDTKVAVLTDKDSDKLVLREFDIPTQQLGNILYQHDKYDLKGASFRKDGSLHSVSFFRHGRYTQRYFNDKHSSFSKRLAKTFPGKAAYLIDNAANGLALIYAHGSDEPGRFYLYRQESEQAELLFATHPTLEDKKLFPSHRFAFQSDDGTELEAFYTPAGELDLNTLLVMPHGGPIGIQETNDFNPEVQYLVSRGFSVLKVNFRGSSGFGKAFREQGVGQFGQLIEEDISAAVNHLRLKHDFSRMCALGASYGGYSAVMLAIKHPQLYDCVVASFGVYDLPLLFNASNYRSGKKYEENLSKVVGEYTDALKLVSPVYLADKVKTPVLLIAGREDAIADFEHTYRMNYVLEKMNADVESAFFKGTGHGHKSWRGDMTEMALTYDFLIRKLGIELDNDKLSALSRKALADDAAILGDEWYYAKRLDKESKKALDYYKHSAELGEARAAFNVGSFYHRGELVEEDMQKAVEYYELASKLGSVSAKARLGRMYFEGEHFTTDFDKSLHYLLQAYEDEKHPEHAYKLARFYCVAPAPHRDLDRCLELLKEGLEDSRSSSGAFNGQIANILVENNFNKDERDRLLELVSAQYDLNQYEPIFELEEQGFFEYRESDVYGKDGQYVLLHDNPISTMSADTQQAFGVKFKLDRAGLNQSSDRMLLALRWTYIDSEGNAEIMRTKLLHGAPLNKWSSLWSMGSKDNRSDNGLWRLDIYSPLKKLLYSHTFSVNLNDEVVRGAGSSGHP